MNIFVLEVGFTVQVLGFNVAHSLGVTRRQKHNIAGTKAFVLNLDDVTHVDVLPLFILKCLFVHLEDLSLCVVLLLVTFVSFVVFKRVFEH